MAGTSELRPFHETIVDALEITGATGGNDSWTALGELIERTIIPGNHNAIVRALRFCPRVAANRWIESVLAQKQAAEAAAKAGEKELDIDAFRYGLNNLLLLSKPPQSATPSILQWTINVISEKVAGLLELIPPVTD